MIKKTEMNLQFFASNQEIITKSISTADWKNTHGNLQEYQAKEYVKLIQEESSFLKLVHSEFVGGATRGNIPKIGVSQENFRPAYESTAGVAGEEMTLKNPIVPFEVQKIRADFEIPKEWENQNLEGTLTTVLNMATNQNRVDLVNLMFNGDKESDNRFRKCQDGFIKKLRTQLPSKQLIDLSKIDGGMFTEKYFSTLKRSVPSKYRNTKYRWICSDETYLNYQEFLINRQTSAGDAALTGEGVSLKPFGVPFEVVPNFPDDVIIFADPKNLTIVYHRDIEYGSTDQGKDLVARNAVYWVWFLYVDFIIMEPEAVAMGIGAGALVHPQTIKVEQITRPQVEEPETDPNPPVTVGEKEEKASKQTKSKTKDLSDVINIGDEV